MKQSKTGTRRWCGWLASWGPLTCLLLCAAPARAFIFPEHAEITRFALDRELTAETRSAMSELLRVAQLPGDLQIALCDELTVPFARLHEQSPKFKNSRCLPFSVLPALAGDHAMDAAELRRALFKSGQEQPLAEIGYEVSERFAEFLDSVPIDVSRLYRNSAGNGSRGEESADGQRRSFFRGLDVRLNVLDSGYVSRARGSRAHFQDSSVPLETLLDRAVSAGELDNALTQTIAHHLRSLQLAYLAGYSEQSRGASEALLEHAFALHFIQDAFAAGHIGTEHAVTKYDRLRRHDYLNRVGLPVMRVLAVRGCNSAVAPRAGSDAAQRCWTAYGDGYLDDVNASHAARASAALTVQVAMAFAQGRWWRDQGSPRRNAGGLGIELIDRCAPERPKELTELVTYKGDSSAGQALRGRLRGARFTDLAASLPPYEVSLRQGTRVRIRAHSLDFDTTLRVVGMNSGQEWSNSDATLVDTDSELTMLVPETEDYAVFVAAQSAGQSGAYQLSIERVSAQVELSEVACAPLLRLAELLDPAPSWTLSAAEIISRRGWGLAERVAIARQLVRGAHVALSQLGVAARRGGTLRPARAGADSGALPGALTRELVGAPFTPCRAVPRWSHRQHPLCNAEGESFQFDAVDAVLVRPLLAAWPGPTASIATVRGEDSFGVGIAGQGIYGVGAAGGFHKQVPWAISPFMFGLGLSGRVDTLLPGSRVNREVLGGNVAVFPIALAGVDDTRYALAGFSEVRSPLWTLLVGYVWGRSAELFSRVDVGPTGFRWYWSVPSRAPGERLRYLGWDTELLNIKLSRAASSARTASIGSAMDTELRVRLGRMDPTVLDPDFGGGSVWTLGLEVESGYSVFLTQLD